ncbi:MAG: hypothetical protein RI554_05160 [Trueperaceae bacterium]|nr:hypothetical protein [Trueperaceae bacterium]
MCVRTGRVRLPARARSVVPDGALEVHDDATGDVWTLRVEGGVVDGLAPFLARHGAMVNDELRLHVPAEAPATLAVRRSGAGGAHGERALRRAVRALIEGAPPHSVEELRDAYGLPADAPLEAALADAPELERRAGRWGRVGTPRATDPLRSASDAPAASGTRPTATPAPSAAADPSSATPAQARAWAALAAFGVEVPTAQGAAAQGAAATVPMPFEGGPAPVYVRVVEPGAGPAWHDLLDEARAAAAGRLALAGGWEDLAPYARYVRSAGAALLPLDALDRLAQAAREGEMTLADLTVALGAGGVHGAAFERLEARRAARRAERERFWEVVRRVASRPVGAVVDPAAWADARLPVAAVREGLGRLAGPPWFAVERLEDGRVRLRSDVRAVLPEVAEAAARLGAAPPEGSRRVAVRGDAQASGRAEILEGGDA